MGERAGLRDIVVEPGFRSAYDMLGVLVDLVGAGAIREAAQEFLSGIRGGGQSLLKFIALVYIKIPILCH